MIAIIDYGAGNLRSVANAITKLGHQPRITSDPGELLSARAAILPGVGAAAESNTRNRNHLHIIVMVVAFSNTSRL